MGRKGWKYRWTRIPDGKSGSHKPTDLSLADGELFVANEEASNGREIQLQSIKKSEEKPPDEKSEEEKIPPVGTLSLFRYSSSCDRLLIIFASLVAVASGIVMPITVIIFGEIVDQFVGFDVANSNRTDNATSTEQFMLESVAYLCMWNTIIGCVFFVCNYIEVSLFNLTAANQAYQIRCRFMQAVLRQDMAWFDTHQTGDFATRITGDLTRIEEGIGEKAGICLNFMSTTVFCVVCGMYFGWKLGLVSSCVAPVLIISMAIVSKLQASASKEESQAYGTAGAVAEEVLSSIRTVVAFGGQEKEIQRYESCLIPASKKGMKRGMLTGIGAGLTWFCIFGGYSVAFWYGVKLILEGMGQPDPEYTGGRIVVIFYNVISASMFIGQTAPYLEAIAMARGAAAKIFSIIESEPTIDGSSDGGLRPASFEGRIRLRDVHFNYPSRPTVPILNGLNLEAKPGETVALVGASGCGKSTIVQLLLRFYDTLSGSVELDGVDVKELNLGWLRDHIGLVGQEPVLFSTTIEENIRMGRNDASQEEIIEAAKTANAHDFIEALPKKYGTEVGERGTQLSGGQKQRIAIARALVRNPRILLLDEATSALDTESEAVVQAALDKARRGRTTIVVAHRLSTIRTADKIIVLDGGVIKETGTHEELMEAKERYYELVVAQTKDEDKEEDDVPEVERHVSLPSSEDASSQARQRTERQISAVIKQTSDKEKVEEEETLDTKALPRSRVLKICAPEWPYLLVGGISAVITGLHYPAFAIVFGSMLGVFSQPAAVIEEESSSLCWIFRILAITSVVFNFLQVFLFTVAGEKLTFRLRKMLFANIITQDISFFDDSKNAVGSLCARLNSDPSSMQGATGSRISSALLALTTFTMAVFIAVYYNWKLGLTILAFLPLVVLTTLLEAKVVSGHMHSETKGLEKASKVATEAIESIKTVMSLRQEQAFYKKYCNALFEPLKKSRLKSHVRGLAYGCGRAVQTFAYATTLYYGSILVSRNEMFFADVVKVQQGIVLGAIKIGQAVAFTPDYEKARVAAVRIFKLLDRRPTIDAFSAEGKTKLSVEGNVDFSNVHFNYPSRPQLRVLRELTAGVEPGQTVALVGSSGCGKTTCVQLLERFYDPNQGKVLVDSDDVSKLNVSNHRSHLALVSQEPILFGRSIAENIAYGDNSRQPDMSEIIEVARQANIHGFVSGLPQGYETPVGDRGTQLSGGQKQRIAIARALIRNPRILLLDEATSALDAESEKVVQEALDQARSGRTCLVIAHRLSTIQNADVILVLHRGTIVEKGTHQELINKKGIYHGLYNIQGREKKEK